MFDFHDAPGITAGALNIHGARLTIHSSRTRFAGRLNSGVRCAQMLHRRSKIRKRHIALLVCLAGLVLAYVFRDSVNDLFGCWAYYDQCTADRVPGLTAEECLRRPDRVVYLPTESVCLVRAKP